MSIEKTIVCACSFIYLAIDFDSTFADDDFVNNIISSEDTGFYTCNVTSTAGFTRIVHINIAVLGM